MGKSQHGWTPWTAEDVAELMACIDNGLSLRETSQRLGRSPVAVRNKIRYLPSQVRAKVIKARKLVQGKPRKSYRENYQKPNKETSDVAQRVCLRCREMFKSSHAGNRICDKHRKADSTSDWLYDNYGVVT